MTHSTLQGLIIIGVIIGFSALFRYLYKEWRERESRFDYLWRK